MGGGTSALSNAVIIGPLTHADVDQALARLAVDRPLVNRSGHCVDLSPGARCGATAPTGRPTLRCCSVPRDG